MHPVERIRRAVKTERSCLIDEVEAGEVVCICKSLHRIALINSLRVQIVCQKPRSEHRKGQEHKLCAGLFAELHGLLHILGDNFRKFIGCIRRYRLEVSGVSPLRKNPGTVRRPGILMNHFLFRQICPAGMIFVPREQESNQIIILLPDAANHLVS